MILRFLKIAAFSTLLCAPVWAAEPVEPPLPAAEKLLEDSANAYLNLESYEGRSSVISSYEMTIAGERNDGTQSAFADISWTRGGAFKAVGVDTQAEKLVVTREKPDAKAQKESVRDGKKETKDYETLEFAIAGATGISAGAFTTIPAALEGSMWGYPFSGKKNTLHTLRRESLGTRECFVVESKDSSGARINWLWIDSQDKLLRRMESRNSAKMFEGMAEATKDIPDLSPQERDNMDKIKNPSCYLWFCL